MSKLLTYPMCCAATISVLICTSANCETVFNTIALAGDILPETDLAFDQFGFPTLNKTGQIAFEGVLSGVGVNSTNNRGVFSTTTGTLELIARTGQSAPGIGNNVVLADFTSSPNLNNAGDTAFNARLSGPGIFGSTNDSGIFAESNGFLNLVAQR